MDWRRETGAILRYPGLPMQHCSSRASTTWYTPAVVRAPCGLGALHAAGGTSPQLWTLLSAAVWRGSPVMSCVLCRRMPMRHSRPSFLFLQLTPCMQFVCVNLYLRRRWTLRCIVIPYFHAGTLKTLKRTLHPLRGPRWQHTWVAVSASVQICQGGNTTSIHHLACPMGILRIRQP